jgi:beta-xylosidase
MNNPIAEGWYADPESRVYGDSVYIYVTHSLPFEEQKNLSLFYTKDLKSFSHKKDILDMKTFRGADFAIWAPSVVEKNGRYYIIFAANNIYHDGEPGGLYIGESASPLGPFCNIYEDGRAFINVFHFGAQPIDAHFYKEGEDVYLYYGGWGHLVFCKMSEDMRTHGTPREITPADYVEAPYVMKADGKYLLMYSSGNWMDGTYRVLCAAADQPHGPFLDSYEVLGNSEIACGAGHNSAFFFGGKHYIAYHRRLYEDQNPHHRILCLDEMQIGNGKILPIEMT